MFKKVILFVPIILLCSSLYLFSQENVIQETNIISNETQQTVSQGQEAKQTQETKETNLTEESKSNVVIESGIVYTKDNVNYVSENTKFALKANDEGSGVKAIYVMVYDSQFGTYETPLEFKDEGYHCITYKIEDNVGNVSQLKFYEFILDKTPPEVLLSTDKKTIKIGDNIYVGTNYSFSIMADDKYSGVKTIYYKINNEEEKIYQNSQNFTGTNGLNTIAYYAVDNVNNYSKGYYFNYYLDIQPPSVSFEIEPAPYIKDNNNFISENTVIKIKAKDQETYVSQILYSIDNSDFVEYTQSFKLKAGVHTIKAKALDIFGNTSEEIFITLNVDAVAPEGNVIPSK